MFDSISPAYTRKKLSWTAYAFAGYFVRRLPLYSVLPKARGLRHGAYSPCVRLSRTPTTTPHPPLLEGIGISSRVSPFLLSTSLAILQEASRVRCGRLKRNDVGGVFLAAPSALCGSPVNIQGKTGLPVLPWQCRALLWPLLLPRFNIFGLDWLAS